MMKVSDPIIFGHAVTTFFPELIGTPGWNPNDGLGALPAGTEIPLRRTSRRWRWSTPTAGSPTCTCPSDVIIDASMPAAIRASGQMWNPHGEQQDTKFVIPDHSYAALYAETVEDCKRNGAFDPATMGTTPERRPDGAGGRGVRLARQDLRDRSRRHACASSTPDRQRR